MNDDNLAMTQELKMKLRRDALADVREFTAEGAWCLRESYPEAHADALRQIEAGEVRLVVYLDQFAGRLTLGEAELPDDCRGFALRCPTTVATCLRWGPDPGPRAFLK